MLTVIDNKLALPGELVERKSSSIANSPYTSFINFLAFSGWANLSAYMSMLYYLQVSPLYDAVNRIMTECSSIQLFVYDRNAEKFEKQHQVLDLLRQPNTDVGRIEFISSLVLYFSMTGNAYIIATGQVGKPPLELFAASPEYITLTPSTRDDYIDEIIYSSTADNVTFKRQYIKGRFRFVSEDGLREIWQIRQINPIRGTTNNYGLSPNSPLYYEIEQYIKASIHNLSLLVRGGRPSGAFTSPENLDDESFSRLQEQLDRFTAGVENAGRLLLLENGLTYQELSMTNKDMDFANLKKSLTVQIYNVFKIPLPLISEQHMSYNNLETARLALYDFAVLPVMKRLLEELTIFLMPRYSNSDNLELAYNENSIPALQLRRNEELMMVKNLGVNTINEIRKMKGDEPLAGGDELYSSGANYPIATAGSSSDLEESQNALNPTAQENDTDDEEEEDEDEKHSRYRDYYYRMKKLRRVDGQLAFTDEQIKQLAVKYGLQV